jgi:acetolactate synthase-1/2/3 large subunit
MTDGRELAVCTVQYGPGSENAFGGVAQCYGDNVPLLYLPTGYPRDQLGVAPNFEAGLNLRNIVKWGETATSAARLPQMLRHAVTQLRNGRPGPAMIEVPWDVQEEEAGDFAWSSPRRSAPQGDPRDIAEVVDAILAAERPMIVAGQGIFYARAWDELREFAELLQLPVMTTLNAKSAFPEDHPLSLGTGGASRPDTVAHFLAKTDLVLGLATSFTRSDYITPVPAGKMMIQVTNSEADLAKDYPISLGLLGDAKAVLGQLIAEAKTRLGAGGRDGAGAVAAEIKAVKDAYLERWMPLLTSEETPINPYRVIWELMQTVDRSRTCVTHDAGSPRDQVTAFYEAIVPHGYMGWGKTTLLGTGMGLMMGAKAARPDWLCVNIMGDAAFGMVGMDFETAVRAELPILTIVLNNGRMGGYAGYLPVASEKFASNLLGGDYAAIAAGLGGYGERVEEPGALRAALQRCIAETEQGRPALLEVITKEEGRMAKA